MDAIAGVLLDMHSAGHVGYEAIVDEAEPEP